MRTYVIFALAILLLSGCAANQTRTAVDYKSPKALLKKSDALVKLEHWGEVQILLKRGVALFPESKAIKKALAKVKRDWDDKKRRLEDWMLVYETEGLLLKRPLLVSMTQSDTNDFLLKSRLLFLDSTLNSKRRLLIACTQHQFDKALKLAKRCVDAAKKIHLSIQVKTLLRKIDRQQSGIKKQKRVRAQKKVALSRAEARNSVLKQARSHLQQQFYYEAVKALEPLARQNKKDQEINILMEEAITGRDLQVLQLISHGDRLYREEHITEAVAVWEQAAILNPADTNITRRIGRAKKVLDNLQDIRSKEPKPATKMRPQ